MKDRTANIQHYDELIRSLMEARNTLSDPEIRGEIDKQIAIAMAERERISR